MLLSLRNPSPALGVELNTLLLQGVQTMDRYPRPILPQSHPSPTPVTLPSFPTSRLVILPVLIWACHFTSGVSRSLISCRRLFILSFCSSLCGHHCCCCCYLRMMLVLLCSQFNFFPPFFITLDLISFVDMFFMWFLFLMMKLLS